MSQTHQQALDKAKLSFDAIKETIALIRQDKPSSYVESHLRAIEYSINVDLSVDDTDGVENYRVVCNLVQECQHVSGLNESTINEAQKIIARSRHGVMSLKLQVNE